MSPPARNASKALEGGILYFITLKWSELNRLSNIFKAICMIKEKVSALKLLEALASRIRPASLTEGPLG